jgi:hypothetical protein
MARIIQKSKSSDLIEEEKKPLRITQWKFYEHDRPGLNVCVGYHVYHIKDITSRIFHQMNAANMDMEYEFRYVRTALICTKCFGKGIVDWINKATPRDTGVNSIFLNDVLTYVRKKNGPIHVLSNLDNSDIYTSTPHKRKGEEYCPDCYGCGIRINHFSHSKTLQIFPS